MKNRVLNRGFFCFLAVFLMLAGVSCSGKKAETKAAAVTKIKFGLGSTYAPFCYLDEKGDQRGFEIELLKAIDERIPEVEFEYESAYFANLMLSLESGQIDAIAHQVGWNAERAEKFLFASENYLASPSYLAVRGDRNDINNLEDLQGKTLLLGPTELANDFVNEFNAQHQDKPILVQFKDGNTDAYVLVATGKVDATIATPAIIWDKAERANLNVKAVGQSVYEDSKAYYVFRKDDALKPIIEKIDQAVKELKADGSLGKISTEFLGDDYS
jgi:L-cystine transport system substrate-binding protein